MMSRVQEAPLLCRVPNVSKILLVLESMAVRAVDAVEAVVVSRGGQPSWRLVFCRVGWFQVSQTLLLRPRVKLGVPSMLMISCVT